MGLKKARDRLPRTLLSMEGLLNSPGRAPEEAEALFRRMAQDELPGEP